MGGRGVTTGYLILRARSRCYNSQLRAQRFNLESTDPHTGPVSLPLPRRDTIEAMLRWSTAGESHGQALIALMEGVPAGLELTSQEIRDALARRRKGYGRGSRQKWEQDALTILSGMRHG